MLNRCWAAMAATWQLGRGAQPQLQGRAAVRLGAALVGCAQGAEAGVEVGTAGAAGAASLVISAWRGGETLLT